MAATDWSAVAKKEHLDQLTVDLRKLEDSIREVYSDMLMLQQREQEMRDISGASWGQGVQSSRWLGASWSSVVFGDGRNKVEGDHVTFRPGGKNYSSGRHVACIMQP